MPNNIYSFYELITEYKVKIPIMQRDYAQGRESNLGLCENFLRTLRDGMVSGETVNLDFIYGNVKDSEFLPLDGQQRLTTLFLLHWYAYKKEREGDGEIESLLKKFTYETRLSSRRFCEALIESDMTVDPAADKLSPQICDSYWFFTAWKSDPTVSAMLNTVDLIHRLFKDVNGIWESLTSGRIVFHLLILEHFGLSDELYIRMNARGKLLTPFENLKAEIQDKSSKERWEDGRDEPDKFAYKIDGRWTRFLWGCRGEHDSIDNAHMNFITAVVMADLAITKGGEERDEAIRKLNENSSSRDLINYIDAETFDCIYRSYELYSRLYETGSVPVLNIEMWRHMSSVDGDGDGDTDVAGNRDILHRVLWEDKTSYTQKVLFFAQTEYLLNNPELVPEKFEEWMRVVRNIVSRANLNAYGKRNDIVRSPETFSGAINLMHELASGSGDIYKFLCDNTVSSSFAGEQVREEILKARIITAEPQYKELIHKTEDNELLRGRISFALECANYKNEIADIDFDMLAKVQRVFEEHFNKELDGEEFDKLRRAMLTIEVDGQYRFYNYWESYWYADSAEKRKLFPNYREIEYFIGSEFAPYFKKLVLELVYKSYDEIIGGFAKPENMENWQYRLIKEAELLQSCSSKYIAIPGDRSYCYLLKSKRPLTAKDSQKIE